MDMTSSSSPTPAKRPSSYEENFKSLLEVIGQRFPQFKHEHHGQVVNVNTVADERLTIGQRIADQVASCMGSWGFIIIQSTLLAFWIILNLVGWINHWDPYPFIFLNLALSFQAAYAAPIIMMSQNRQSTKDRLTAENDFATNVKGEQEVRHVMEHMDHQDELTRQIMRGLEMQNQHLEKQNELILQIVQQLTAQSEHLESQHQEIISRMSNPET